MTPPSQLAFDRQLTSIDANLHVTKRRPRVLQHVRVHQPRQAVGGDANLCAVDPDDERALVVEDRWCTASRADEGASQPFHVQHRAFVDVERDVLHLNLDGLADRRARRGVHIRCPQQPHQQKVEKAAPIPQPGVDGPHGRLGKQ